MKTEYKVTFKDDFILNNTIAKLVAYHNSGKVTYSLPELEIIFKGKITEYPVSLSEMTLTHLESELVICESPDNISAIIHEIKL